MRLPPQGVCRLFLGGFVGQKLENPEFRVVFVKKTMFRALFFSIVVVLFFGEAFAEVNTMLFVFGCC